MTDKIFAIVTIALLVFPISACETTGTANCTLRNPNEPAASYGYMWGNDRSYTAADLDKDCSEKKGIREAKCVAYIRGITDGLFVASVAASMNGHTCMTEIMPSEAKARQIVEKYLRDHPEQKAANASAVAGIALSTALKTSCTPRIF